MKTTEWRALVLYALNHRGTLTKAEVERVLRLAKEQEK